MNGDAIRLFHVSDIHFGMEDAVALAWVRQCIETERPDAVAITGDLTMRARHTHLLALLRSMMIASSLLRSSARR